MTPTVEFTALTMPTLRQLAARCGGPIADVARRLPVDADLSLSYLCMVDGAPVGAGGVIVKHIGIGADELPTGFAEGWLLPVPGTVPSRAWPTITRRAIAELDHVASLGIRSIEIAVDPASGAAIRWALRLGFEVQGWRRAWGTTGKDYVSMARVRQPASQERRAA